MQKTATDLLRKIFTATAMLLLLVCFAARADAIDELAVEVSSAAIGKRFVPKDFSIAKARVKEHADENIRLKIFSRNFTQGDLVYIEIAPNEVSAESISSLKLAVKGAELKTTRRQWGWRAFFAISPEETLQKIDVQAAYILEGYKGLVKTDMPVVKADFPVYEKSLFLGKYSDLTYQEKPEVIAYIEESKKKKARAFASIGPDVIGSAMAHPRDIDYITSPFWSKRKYQRFRKENGKTIKLKDSNKIHHGLDLRGDKGAPVFAVMDGKVVLADKLFYEGNFLVLDHGNKIFSYYMHLDSILVKEGDTVRAGQNVARVGSTGVSTGAHLHVSLLVRGVQVDPLSILSLPVRD